MKSNIVTYKDLLVWQRAMDLVVMIYELTNNFPADERFGLISQMRRCAISIPLNIVEGRRRGTRLDYAHFLRIAYGSGAELETQIEISRRLKYVDLEKSQLAEASLFEIMKMLNVMLRSLLNLQPNS